MLKYLGLPGENLPNWGQAIQIFYDPDDLRYHMDGSVQNCDYYSDVFKAEIREQCARLADTFPIQPYYRRIDGWKKCLIKEVILMCPSRLAVVSLAVHKSFEQTCTMREVFASQVMATDSNQKRALTAMTLELVVLQHLKHRNIVDLLSINYDQDRDRYLTFYEASVPLMYYAKEFAYRDRPDSVKMFENHRIPIYILKSITSALSHLCSLHINLQGEVYSDDIYITAKGVPKLGSLLKAKLRDDYNVHKLDLACLTGVFLALLHRDLDREQVQLLARRCHATRDTFEKGYFYTVNEFPQRIGGEVDPVIPSRCRELIKRALSGHLYDGIGHFLVRLDNFPSMHRELAELVLPCANYLQGPWLGSRYLPYVPPPVQLENWDDLAIMVNVFIQPNQLDGDFYITLGELISPQPYIWGVITEIMDFSYYHNGRYVTPEPPQPQDMLVLYMAIVSVQNEMVEFVNRLPRNVDPLDLEDFEGFFLDPQQNRGMHIRMWAWAGQRVGDSTLLFGDINTNDPFVLNLEGEIQENNLN